MKDKLRGFLGFLGLIEDEYGEYGSTGSAPARPFTDTSTNEVEPEWSAPSSARQFPTSSSTLGPAATDLEQPAVVDLGARLLGTGLARATDDERANARGLDLLTRA